jgi:hypothetical protein
MDQQNKDVLTWNYSKLVVDILCCVGFMVPADETENTVQETKQITSAIVCEIYQLVTMQAQMV